VVAACIKSTGSICATNAITGSTICGTNCISSGLNIVAYNNICATNCVRAFNSVIGNTIYGTSCIVTPGDINSFGRILSAGVDLLSIINGTYNGGGGTGPDAIEGLYGRYQTQYYNTPTVKSFGSNGCYNSFNLGDNCAFFSLSPSQYFINVNGVLQAPGVDYTLDYSPNGSLNFISTPPPYNNISVFAYDYESVDSVAEPVAVKLTGDGARKTLPLKNNLGGYNGVDAYGYKVTIDGLLQRPEIDYTINSLNNGSISFTEAPYLGATIVVRAFNTKGINLPTLSQFETNGSCNNFVLGSNYYGCESINYLVSINGALQQPDVDYTVSENDKALIFTSVPPQGSIVSVFSENHGKQIIHTGNLNTPVVTSHLGSGSKRFYNLGEGMAGLESCGYLVSVGGLLQTPDIDYTMSSVCCGSILLEKAPPAGSRISVFSLPFKTEHLPKIVSHEADGICSLYKAGSGLPFYNSSTNRYMVTVGNVLQTPYKDFCGVPDDDGSICFSTPPPADLPVAIYTFNFIPSAYFEETTLITSTVCAPIITNHKFSGTNNISLGENSGYFGENSKAYLVTINGLIQEPNTDYYATKENNGSIRFTSIPPLNSDITIYAYPYTNSSNASSSLKIEELGVSGKISKDVISITKQISGSNEFLVIKENGRPRFISLDDVDASFEISSINAQITGISDNLVSLTKPVSSSDEFLVFIDGDWQRLIPIYDSEEILLPGVGILGLEESISTVVGAVSSSLDHLVTVSNSQTVQINTNTSTASIFPYSSQKFIQIYDGLIS
jgi:hypothetical protein